MFFELFLAATFMALGNIFFRRFEELTCPLKSVIKLVVVLGLTALVSNFAGSGWAIVFVVGVFALATVGHVVWALQHGIHPLKAEPRAKYYALRGWEFK